MSRKVFIILPSIDEQLWSKSKNDRRSLPQWISWLGVTITFYTFNEASLRFEEGGSCRQNTLDNAEKGSIMQICVILKKFSEFLAAFISNSTFVVTMMIIAPAVSSAQEDPLAANPSRPSITNSPDLGPVGHIEVNFGATAYTAGTTTWMSPLLLKYTVVSNFELRVGTNGMSFSSVPNEPVLGPRDVSVLAQWIPVPAVNDELHWALTGTAIVPMSGGVAAPNAWDYSTGIALGKNIFGVIWQSNVNAGISGGDGMWLGNCGITELLSYSMNKWSPFVDAAYTRSAGNGADGVITIMAGTGFTLTPLFVLDASFAVERSSGSTNHSIMFGLSVLY